MEQAKIRNYSIVLVGEKVTDEDDSSKSSIEFIRTTNPDKQAKEAGFNAQDWVQCQLHERVPDGTIGGNRRYLTLNLFENSDSAIFDLIKEKIVEKDYDEIKGSKLKVKLKAPMPGTIRMFETPFKYTPKFRNDEGIEENLRANPRQPDGSFLIKKDRPDVVMNTGKVFILESEFESMDAIVTTEIERLRANALPESETTKVTVEKKVEPQVTDTKDITKE